MNLQSDSTPVFHEAKYQPGHYAKVYWPIRDSSTGEALKKVCIAIGSTYVSESGKEIEVVSIFEGKLYPMVNYRIGDSDKICATSLNWFVYNIANS